MITKDNSISLTYQLGGESLAKAGVYISAKIKVKNAWQEDESVTIVKPMVTVSEAKYSYTTQNIELGTHFMEACLERPKKPREVNINRWLRTAFGKLHQDWNKLSVEQRIYRQVQIYIDDMGGKLISWEIL